MDEYKIDSHKLMYHVDRLYHWSKGEDIYPVYAEIAPCGSCNHRCIFCALDYMGYKPLFLETKAVLRFLNDIAKSGAKSIMFAGEGEPFLHKDIAGLISFARSKGLDVAVTSNGVLLSKTLSEEILGKLSWLRISLNAGTAATYAAVHRTSKDDFRKVVGNIEEAVRLKRKKGYNCVIGVQLLLLNENYKEIPVLAGILQKIGADYLIIKPYSQHPLSVNRLKKKLNYRHFLFIEKSLKRYEKCGLQVIFRKNTMLKIGQERSYKKCLGLPFWTYLSAKGDLYACSAFLGDERFCYGNIYKDSFEKIWKSGRRKKIMKMMKGAWDIKNCREVCRLDEINRYLWNIKNPPEHVNFI